MLSPQTSHTLPSAVVDALDAYGAALRYLEFGLTPLAVSDKRAAKKWKEFQKRPPSAADLHYAFEGRDDLGVAIVTGVDDLMVRDFDLPGAYASWSREFPELARTLPTVQTGQSEGRHVYFRSRDPRTKHLDDGELRGVGAYVVAPPSKHSSGTLYRWLIPFTPDLPYLDLEESGLGRTWSRAESRRQTVTQGIRKSCIAIDDDAAALVPARTLDEAIERTRPRERGTRWRRNFLFCRQLKGMPDYADKSASELRAVAQAWYRAALPNIRTKDWRTTWIDFQNNWKIVRCAAGGSLERAIATALKNPTPGWTQTFPPKRRFLVAVLLELQRQRPGQSFFMSARGAAEIMNFEGRGTPNAMAGHRALKKLVEMGLIEVVERPSRKSRRAWHYRFVEHQGRSIAAPPVSQVA